MKKQTKTYYGPYELTDHLQHQFVVTCGAEHDTRAHAQPSASHMTDECVRVVRVGSYCQQCGLI